MHKRTLAVLAVAAAAGAVLPFGLPKAAQAAGPTYASLSIKPLPAGAAGNARPQRRRIPSPPAFSRCDGSGHVGPGGRMSS